MLYQENFTNKLYHSFFRLLGSLGFIKTLSSRNSRPAAMAAKFLAQPGASTLHPLEGFFFFSLSHTEITNYPWGVILRSPEMCVTLSEIATLKVKSALTKTVCSINFQTFIKYTNANIYIHTYAQVSI